MAQKKKSKAYYASETSRTLDVIIGDIDFKPKTENQKLFCDLIDAKEIIVASGPAGVGKSMVSIAKALQLLKSKKHNYEKIIICKPAVESGEELGFLKGDLHSKLEPFLYSSMYLFEKILGEEKTKTMLNMDF